MQVYLIRYLNGFGSHSPELSIWFCQETKSRACYQQCHFKKWKQNQ
uniref:Uncharacterized protein n=1 Tax=Arundo donax TaxID=35708 RepID=A0A0A8Y5E9_ARUDO